MTITTTKLVDNNNKIIVNSNGIGGEFQQKLVDVVGSNKKVEISGRGNWGLKPDEIKIEDPIGDVFLNSDDTVKKYNLVIETHKEAGYK